MLKKIAEKLVKNAKAAKCLLTNFCFNAIKISFVLNIC